jgi:DNA-binding transcriptional LysR family regulator
MDELTCIRAFVSVVDAGSFSESARRLNTSVSTVARRVAELEARLGVRLLNRNTRQQAPTEAGSIYCERMKGVLSEIEVTNQDTSSYQRSVKGNLRVSLRASSGALILPRLPEFLKNYPDLTLEVSLTDDRLDLVQHKIDLAVWLGHLEDSSLVAKRLTQGRRVVCASPAYFEEHGIPETPDDLANHNCLLFKAKTHNNVWRFSKNEQRFCVPVGGNLSSASGPVLHLMAISGLGIVVLQEYMARDDLAKGRLKAVLVDFEVTLTDFDTALYAVYPHRRNLSPKARVFLDFLIEIFRTRNVPEIKVEADSELST